jgi:hypothetical protein
MTPTLARTGNELPPSPRRVRRWLVLSLLILAGLVAGAYVFEKWRGARALEHEQEIMRSQGLEVDWRALLRGPVPDAENFGATPILKGLAADTREAPVPVRGMESMRWDSIRFAQPEKDEDWRKISEVLAGSEYFPTAPEGVEGPRAVYVMLERMEPIFAELTAVAGRPAAVFTPSPKERQAAAEEDVLVWPVASRPLTGLTRLMEIRATAAVALNEAGEALRIIRILRRMYEASQLIESPHSPPLFLPGIAAEGLRRHIWKADQMDELTGHLALADPAAAVAGCYHRFMLQDYDAAMTDWDSPFRFFSGNWWRFRATPEGWKDQGRAELLRVARERLILPIRQHGISALLNGKAGIHKDDHSRLSLRPTSWIFQYSEEIRKPVIFAEMIRRLTILAAAAEKHRLQTGQPVREPGQILTALPPEQRTDLDGQPLRLEISTDGKLFSVYSVGTDLRDDGNARTARGLASPSDYDWSLQIPQP